MKKAILLLSAIVLIAQTTFTNPPFNGNDLKRLLLSGRVKTVTTRNSTVIEQGNKITKTTEFEPRIAQFDRRGYLTEELQKRDHVEDEKTVYIYNQAGRLVERRNYLVDPKAPVKEQLQDSYQYVHGSKNLVVEIRNFDGLAYKGSTTYTYDASGNCIEELSQSEFLITLGKVTHTYDRRGNRLSSRFFTGAGELIFATENEYNNSGQIIKTRQFDQNNVLVSETTYTHDNRGSIISEKSFYSQDIEDGDNISYKYKYDGAGNWTQRIKYIDENAVDMTERMIEYY